MSHSVEFEDRTTESPEKAVRRQVAGPAAVLTAHAIHMASGNPGIALHILAAALGQAMARAGVPAEEAAALTRPYHESAQSLIEEQFLLSSRHADA